MKKFFLVLFLILTLVSLTGCQKKSANSTDSSTSQPANSAKNNLKTFSVTYSNLTTGPIDEQYKFSDPEQYDIFDPANPLYYDQEKNEYWCGQAKEKAEVKQIFPPAGTLVGPSRFSYYCPSADFYWIRDFPGYAKATLYGPFQGRPE